MSPTLIYQGIRKTLLKKIKWKVLELRTMAGHPTRPTHTTQYVYPVLLEPDEGTVLLTCPDIPSVITYGDDEVAALHHAVDAITLALDTMMDDGREIPEPSKADGRPVVRLPTLTAAKLAVYQAMRSEKISQAELARRMNIDPRQVRRLLDLYHGSRFEDIEAALAAVGLRPVFAVERAA